MFFFSLILLIYGYKYILVLLVIIELIVVNISLIIFVLFSIMGLEFYLIYYLVFRVCERVLGLRLLVIVVRFYGSELYYVYNMRKF